MQIGRCSDFLAYNRLMKNQSIKPLALLGGLLLATTPAKAEEPGEVVFWYSYTVGAGTSLCMGTEAGKVSKGYAAEFMQGTLAQTETDPELTPFKQYFLKGYEELKEIWPNCYE